MSVGAWARVVPVLIVVAATSSCVTRRPPTIAHVHIGHAITAVHVTPGHKGYMEVAAQRADEALAAVESAQRAGSLAAVKADVALAARATDDPDNFGLKQSVIMAANHVSFAGTSADASDNVVRFAPVFKNDIAAVVGRCDYIELLAKDVAASGSLEEALLVVDELLKAAQANKAGDDSKGDGERGSVPADYGVAQLNAELAAMVAREHPAYRTVDDWYLFNLVRLPNGRWVFDRLGRGGNIDGYK